MKKSLRIRICSVTLFISLFCFFIIGYYLKKAGVEYAYGWASISFSLIIFLPIILGVEKISFPIIIVAIYLVLGIAFNLWHPWWALFFLIPIFYAVFPNKHKEEKEKNKEYVEVEKDDEEDC